MEFENELCIHDEHLIAKMYKLLLRFETEEEPVKGCMINELRCSVIIFKWTNEEECG